MLYLVLKHTKVSYSFRYSVIAVEASEVFFEAFFGDVSLYGSGVYALACFIYVSLVDVCAEDLNRNVS